MITRKNFRENVRPAYYEVSVDTARTVSKRADYTAITAAMFDGGGRCYIVEIDHGKFHEETTAEKIIYFWHKYRPSRILMETDPSNSGIRVWLQRKQENLDIHLPIHDVKRVLGPGKKQKIKSTLRPWYISGDLRFLDDLVAYEALKRELQGFPQVNDDILDSLTMLFHDKPVMGRNSERPPVEAEAYRQHIQEKYNRERMKRMIESAQEQQYGPVAVSETGWL